MQIEVRLLARLLRLPLLRIDGFVVLRDDPEPAMTLSLRSPGPTSAPAELSPSGRGPSTPVGCVRENPNGARRMGRDLSEAEQILASLDG